MGETQTDYLRTAKRRRVAAQNFAAFAELIANPVKLDGGLEVPANVRLGVSTNLKTNIGDALITVDSVEVMVIGGQPDTIFRVQFAEVGQIIRVAPHAKGRICLYVFDDMKQSHLIATSGA